MTTSAPLHAIELGIQQDSRASDCRRESLHGFFQLRSLTSNAPRHACDAGWINRPRLDRAKTHGVTVKRWLSLHIRSPPPATLICCTTESQN